MHDMEFNGKKVVMIHNFYVYVPIDCFKNLMEYIETHTDLTCVLNLTSERVYELATYKSKQSEGRLYIQFENGEFFIFDAEGPCEGGKIGLNEMFQKETYERLGIKWR